MKKLLIIAMLGLFGVVLVGCTHNRGHHGGYHASNDVHVVNTIKA